MKVLFIGPIPEPVTGQSLACKVLLDELLKKHDVELIDINKTDFSSGLDSLRRVKQVLSFFVRAYRGSRSCDGIYFTIAESFAGNVKDMLLYLACYSKLGNMAVHLHGGAGMRVLLGRSNRLIRMLNEFFLRRMKAVIVLGASHVDIFDGVVPKEKIQVVPNFAQDSLFIEKAAISEKFKQTTPLRLLFLSNMLPGKGYLELLEGLKMLSAQENDCLQVDFAGGFLSDTHKVEFFEKTAGLKNVFYHGVVSGSVKAELLHRAHIFCLPTYYPYEGQPISILEAYASGCVVMATAHSGIPDIFSSQKNGFLVEVRSATSVCHAIQRALDMKSQLKGVASSNREEAEKFYRAELYNRRLLKIIDDLA